MNNLLKSSGLEIAKKIREKEITSREAVQAHIEQIKLVNPQVNAMVADRFDSALKEADQSDEKLPEMDLDQIPPYFGVPCSIKESFAVKGMPNSGGLYSRKNVTAEKDAVTVKRMRQAGAIPLGVTNVSELCMWMESYNKVYGRTNNAYDLTRHAGGSSGGEGAIITAGGAPLGLGSDIGGSVRLPAFFSGIFGHKPSGGLVPNSGQFPMSAGPTLRIETTGPLCRRAEDLEPLLKILAGPDAGDPYCEPCEIGNAANVDILGLNFYFMNKIDSIFLSRVSDDLSQALEKCIRALETKGLPVKKIDSKKFKNAPDIWMSSVTAGNTVPFKSLMADGNDVSFIWELIKNFFGYSNFTLAGIVLALIEDYPNVSPERSMEYIREGKYLRNELEDILGPKGVLLCPSHPNVALRHNEPLLRPLDWLYTGIFNALELPATQVPLGLNRAGLPVGISGCVKSRQ